LRRRYSRNVAVGRDLCVYSGKDSGTNDGQSRDVISWQRPKSREEIDGILGEHSRRASLPL